MGLGVWVVLTAPATRTAAATVPASPPAPAAAAVENTPPTPAPGSRWIPAGDKPPESWPAAQHRGDSMDLANHIRPGDPVPSTAALIQALRQSGIHDGIAAFNPPGTMPLLSGLAVPTDFPLPPGYVRHHQVTDAGVPIEPILMFAPDTLLLDGSGQPLALPADRVVPPHLAPPGLPLRWVRPDSP
jgi:hypothetical protein